MEVKQKKEFIIPIEDILKAFNISSNKEKAYIFYSSVRDELRIQIEEV